MAIKDPRVTRLERAAKRRAAAETEFNEAVTDLLANGPRGSQATAARITGLTREALRLRMRQNGQAATTGGPA